MPLRSCSLSRMLTDSKGTWGLDIQTHVCQHKDVDRLEGDLRVYIHMCVCQHKDVDRSKAGGEAQMAAAITLGSVYVNSSSRSSTRLPARNTVRWNTGINRRRLHLSTPLIVCITPSSPHLHGVKDLHHRVAEAALRELLCALRCQSHRIHSNSASEALLPDIWYGCQPSKFAAIVY